MPDKSSRQDDRRPREAARSRPPVQPRTAHDQAVDDELTEALMGTFPGSDPVALESPLVSRAPNKKRS